MKDGRKLLGQLGGLKPSEVYFRTHSLLVTGEGTHALKWGSTNAYTEDAQGNPILHRLALPAEGLGEMGGACLSVGKAFRGKIRRGRGAELVLANLERI